ncbi:MAG: NADPH-dependent oxidoreductase [Balneolaceae bacterium]|nr:MAG: NADPH-dependent oxidoreductase [Balneolaceae bacterium]
MKINILSSTDRPGSKAMNVSGYAAGILSRYVDTEVFSLEDYPLADVAGGKYGRTPQSVNEFNSSFLDADGFLFVIPEYNGSFPGILKIFIDYLPFPVALERRPISLIGESSGAFGAMRAVEQFEQILKYRKAYIFPERMFIQRVDKTFDSGSGLSSDVLQKLLEKQLKEFPEFVESLTKQLVEP